jgi:glycosyltransferase involved in cell wall biosynthesis
MNARLESVAAMEKVAPRVAVILPAYNEELTIAGTIESFARELPEARIVVVNNNSKDRTAEIATATIQRLGCDGEVIHERCQGKGNAMRRAFMEVEADVYVLSDADMTYPAEQARELMRPVLQNEADMVVGDRHSGGDYSRENKRALHGMGNRLVQGLINSLFRSKLVDIMSGYRVMNRRFVKNYPILVDGFQVETDLTLHALDKRFRIVEVPVAYKDRPSGSFSKLNTLSDGMRVVWTIFRILRHYRPMPFFGSLALAFFLAGLAAGMPVLSDWIRFKYIYHVPLAVLATGCEIVAVVMLAIGLVLDSLVHLQRMAYERELLAFVARK